MGRVVRRGGGRFQSSAPKRQIANDGIEGENQATLTFLATNVASTVMTLALLLVVPAATLVRTRGHVTFRLRASGAINNSISGAFGMFVTTIEAFNAGIASLPLPLDDIENDWFVWEPFTFWSSAAGGEGAGAYGRSIERTFDSRGQRKLKAGDVLVGIVEGVQISATTGTIVDVNHQTRHQFKL